MDHALAALLPFMEVEVDIVREEWSSGDYRKLSDCPSYESAKALVDAMHKLEKYYYGKHMTLSVRDAVRW